MFPLSGLTQQQEHKSNKSEANFLLKEKDTQLRFSIKCSIPYTFSNTFKDLICARYIQKTLHERQQTVENTMGEKEWVHYRIFSNPSLFEGKN